MTNAKKFGIRHLPLVIRTLHAEEFAGLVEDLLVYFEGPSLPGEPLDAGPRHGADEVGNVREPRFGGRGPSDRDRLARPVGRRRAEMLGSLASAAEVHRTGIGSPAWSGLP